MRATFQLKTLAIAVAAFSVASMANAAGLDRSGQDVTAFLQDGLYAEAVYTYIDADVSGYDNAYVGADDKAYKRGDKIDDISEYYDFFRYGVKTDINDTFSLGILYDEPFGAAVEYSGDNNFVAQGDRDAGITAASEGKLTSFLPAAQRVGQLKGILAGGGTLTPPEQVELAKKGAAVATAQAEYNTRGEGTNVEVRSESITAILGMKLGENKNFQVYGGPVAQRIKADLEIRGLGYGSINGYDLHASPDQDYGWLAGVSYSKPEIALKAALTYRSEIDHDLDLSETLPIVGALGGNPTQSGTMELNTPKSVNFDFQTGINPTTLATAKVRWVPWGDFSITPPLLNETSKATSPPNGLPLIEYSDDAWVVELGLAKRLAPALAVSGNIGWDSGSGNPTTSLGPIEGYYSAGLGAKYNVTENWAVSAGGKYLWFGDAKGHLSSKKIVSNFEDNDGYAFGVKLSYQAKQKFN